MAVILMNFVQNQKIKIKVILIIPYDLDRNQKNSLLYHSNQKIDRMEKVLLCPGLNIACNFLTWEVSQTGNFRVKKS